MRTSAFFCAKILGFFEIYAVSARTSGGGGGWASADIFWTRRSIFRDFVRTSSYCANYL